MSGFEAAIPYLVGASVGVGASALMSDSGAAQSPTAPTVKPPTPMPDPKGQKDAKRKSLAEMMRRQGRASTILTDTSNDALGGSARQTPQGKGSA